jgi:hypothetical protein
VWSTPRDQGVVALGGSDHQIVDHDRRDRLAVGRDQGQRQAVDREPEEARARAVDQPEPGPRSCFYGAGPGVVRRLPVEQIAGVGHVDAKRRAVGKREGIAHRDLERALPDPRDDIIDRDVRDVAQHDGQVFVVGVGLVRIFDDQRARQALLLLQAEVRVIPVGSGLLEGELVVQRIAGRDRRLGDVGHAVLQVRAHEAMPVQAGGLVQAILHEDPEAIPLAVADRRARPGAARQQCLDRRPERRHLVPSDREDEVGSGAPRPDVPRGLRRAHLTADRYGQQARRDRKRAGGRQQPAPRKLEHDASLWCS